MEAPTILKSLLACLPLRGFTTRYDYYLILRFSLNHEFGEKRGKYNRAHVLYKQSYKMRIAAMGPEHPLVARSLHEIAELYQKVIYSEQIEVLQSIVYLCSHRSASMKRLRRLISELCLSA